MNARRFSSTRQRGSVIVFAALGLSLMVILLSISDIGFLYFYKREYQKAADLSAMAGAKSLIGSTGTRSCVGNATPAAQANAAQNLGGKNYNLVVSCGKWNPEASSTTTRFDTSASANTQDAVKSVVSGTPPRFLPFIGTQTLTATAIAAADQPLAVLNIRSTLASVDTSRLNAVFGGLLGGSVNLDLASWNGLLAANVNLLNYLDALAVRLGVSAGHYDQLLSTNTSVGTLLAAAVDALGSGTTAGLAVSSLAGSIGGSVSSLTMKAGDFISLQTGAPATGLGLDMNAFTLVQAAAQLANSKSAVTASISPTLFGFASGVQVTIKVIDPPQISAIGNPALAKAGPLGANKIYVRTAQVRTLISVSLGSALDSLVSGLLTAVNNLVGPLTGLLNGLLTLNLSCVLGVCTSLETVLVPPPFRIDVNLDAASANAYVSDYSCTSGSTAKSLSVPATTSVASLRIGKMGTSNADAISKVFASSAAPTVDPVALVRVDKVTRNCVVLCGPVVTRTQFAGGGVGLKTNTTVASSSSTLSYIAPAASNLPLIEEAPAYQTISATSAVSSLATTLAGAGIQLYEPTAPVSGLGVVISVVGTTLNTVTPLLQTAVATVLSPLLDPLVNNLLETLGVKLAQADVGARLSCSGGGATLVN